MNELLIALLSVAGTILAGVISFVLGQRSERRRQTLLIRASMLDPIREWLGGVEKFIGILGDTLNSVTLNSPVPLTYDFEERRKSAQFMSEKTNEILGILDADSFTTSSTKAQASRLAEVIRELDRQVKYRLLPLDNQIIQRAAAHTLTQDFIMECLAFKVSLDTKVQEAHALISKIKTRLT